MLARLLSPQDYGLVAIAAVFTNFAYLFRDLGTGSALIQKIGLNQATKSAVFWLNVSLGGFIFFVLLLVGPLLSSYYSQPELVFVLCGLALSFPITCSGLVHQALLERDSNFRSVAICESIATALSLTCALVAAYSGLGVYSLVLQQILLASVQTTLLWWRSPWRPNLRPSLIGLGEVVGFGGRVSAFQFFNYFSRNADSFIIGKLIGVVALGVYSVSYRIMLFPVQNLSWVAARIVYPMMSRLHEEGGAVGTLYMKSVGAIAFVSAPLMAVVFTFREPFVAIVLGEKWGAVPALLALLAPIGFIQSILGTSGSAFMASNRAQTMLKWGVWGAVIQVSGFVIGAQFGLTELVISYLLASFIIAILTFGSLLSIFGLPWSKLGSVLVYPVVGSISIGAGCSALDKFLAENITSLTARLCLGASVFGVLYLGAARIFAAEQVGAFISVFVRRKS